MQYGKLYKVHNEYLCRVQKSSCGKQNALTFLEKFDMLKKVGFILRM